jgi:hypothetical protein
MVIGGLAIAGLSIQEKASPEGTDEPQIAVSKAFTGFLKSPQGLNLLKLIIASGLLHAALTPYFNYSQILFKSYGMEAASIALLVSVAELMTAFAGLFTCYVGELAPLAKLLPASLLMVSGLIALNLCGSRGIAIGIFLLAMGMPQIIANLIDGYIQEKIPSEIRSTCMSLLFFVESVLICISYLGLGALFDHVSPSIVISGLALLPLASLIMVGQHFRGAQHALAQPTSL